MRELMGIATLFVHWCAPGDKVSVQDVVQDIAESNCDSTTEEGLRP